MIYLLNMPIISQQNNEESHQYKIIIVVVNLKQQPKNTW